MCPGGWESLRYRKQINKPLLRSRGLGVEGGVVGIGFSELQTCIVAFSSKRKEEEARREEKWCIKPLASDF